MTTARGYSISMTAVVVIVRLYGMIPIGNVIKLHNKPAKNQPASPAIAAVPGPAPKRGRMVAYNHTRDQTTDNHLQHVDLPHCDTPSIERRLHRTGLHGRWSRSGIGVWTSILRSWPLRPNESRLSCGALTKDSFLNLRAPPASSAC